MAAALSDLTGRPVTCERVAPESFEARLRATGTPARRAFDLAHIASAYTPDDHLVGTDFAELTARDPRSLATFLSGHREAFAMSGGA